MKIFSWMQSKLNAKQVTKKPNAVLPNNHMPQSTSKEEFNDWPQALLAIGTFGISNLKEDPEKESQDSCQTAPEEVGGLQENINPLLDTPDSESEAHNPPLEPVCEDLLYKDVCLQRNTCAVGNDMFLDNKNNVIRKKSLTFLLKKIFSSRSGFGSSLRARDSLPDPTVTIDKPIMEKILRAILNKKIHPQSSTAKTMAKKYLERKDTSLSDDSEGEMSEDDNDGSKWVKTDSEYIVLEI